MPDPLSSVTAGQPLSIRAAAWNEIVAAARDRRQPPRPDKPVERFVQTGCVEALAFNDTGADLPAFKPAKITGTSVYDLTTATAYDWSRRPVVTIGTPGAATDIVAVTLEAIPEDQFGRVAVAGWCACDVDVGNSGDRYASPTTDTDALVSATTGSIRILNTGTGTARRCAVYLGDQIDVGSSGTNSYDAQGLAAWDNTQATDTFSSNQSVSITSGGTYLCVYGVSCYVTASVAGSHLIAEMRASGGSPSSSTFGRTYFGTVQVASQTVYDSAYGFAVITFGGASTVSLHTARSFLSGTITATMITGSYPLDSCAVGFVKLY